MSREVEKELLLALLPSCPLFKPLSLEPGHHHRCPPKRSLNVPF